jgi:hypothetical protein
MNHKCALCTQSGSSVELKRCVNCPDTYYCSRECQRQHWKIHKKQCNTYTAPPSSSHDLPINSSNPRQSTESLSKVTPIPRKGQGVVATHKIPKGTRILSERPIFVVPRTTQRLARLDEDQRKSFFALHNSHGNKHTTALGIARTNLIPLGAAAEEGGLFLHASRINHACRHNAQNT